MEFVLDCKDCERGDAAHAADCVVAYLLDRPEGGIVFNISEERAIRALGEAGLLPEARFKRLSG